MKAVAILALLATSAAAADDAPKPFTFARYQSMMDRSPFAVATAAAPPPPSAPNFAKDLYVANAAKLPGEDVVTVGSSADKNLKEYISSKAPNAHGFSIANIEWSEKVGATKVTISKDGQFAPLSFNQALLSQPIASAQPQLPQPPLIQPQITQPTIQPSGVSAAPIPSLPQAFPPTTTGMPRAMPIPSIPAQLPTPPSRVRGVIPRNPAANGQAQPVSPPPQADL